MPRFHDAVAQGRECDEQRAWKPGQRRIRALDEQALTIRARPGLGEIQPPRRSASPDDQPRPAALDRFQEMFPGNRVVAVAIGNRQHEVTGRIDRGHDERVRRAGHCGHDVAATNCLESGLDLPRAARASVVDDVPAIPTRAAAAHLRNPRPHVLAGRIDGDGVSGREDSIGNHAVDCEPTASFEPSSQTSRERHNTQNRAFAVPRCRWENRAIGRLLSGIRHRVRKNRRYGRLFASSKGCQVEAGVTTRPRSLERQVAGDAPH
jgi:hypothetical protein